MRASDSNDFAHNVQQERPGLRGLANRANRDAHRGGRRRKPNQKNELLPYLPADIAAELSIDPAGQARRVKRVDAGGAPTVELANDQPFQRAGSRDR